MKRRDALKKLVYVTPVILSLPAIPAFASRGSGAGHRSSSHYHHDAWGTTMQGHIKKHEEGK